jgi:DNA replication protein DnaC
MKLAGMLAAFEETLKQAETEALSPTEFLDLLVQAEYDFREMKKVENKIKTSKLKLKPEIEDFDYTAKRTITKAQVKDLYSLSWMGKGRVVLLIGPTGICKTFLAQALGLHACRKNYSTLFLTITDFLENLLLARSAGTFLKYREKITKPDLLILDDFGARKFNATESQDLCEIIEERSMAKSTIITTQLPINHWKEVIPDPVIADSIIDRVKHSAITLTIEGDTYRKVLANKLAKEKNLK